MDIRHAVGVKAGIPETKLAALASYATSPEFSAREHAALEFAEHIVRDDREVSDECFERLRRYFTESEILELTFIVGYQTFASKFAKAFQLAPQGFSMTRAPRGRAEPADPAQARSRRMAGTARRGRPWITLLRVR